MDVFVSYSNKDMDFTKKMCDILREHGITYWVAYENEMYGENYASTIVNAITDAEVFLVLVSEASNDSIHVLNEINCAVGRKKVIIPVLIEEVKLSTSFEYYLSCTHWLNYSPTEEFTRQLTHRICSLVGKSEEKAEPEVTVAEPEEVTEPIEVEHISLEPLPDDIPADEDIFTAMPVKPVQEEPETISVADPASLPEDMVDEEDTVADESDAETADNEFKTLDSEKLDSEESADTKGDAKSKDKKGIVIAVILAALILIAIIVADTANRYGTSAPDSVETNFYSEAEAALASGDKAQAAILFGKAANEGYADARERSIALWDEVVQCDAVSAGDYHTVGLKADGTVVAVGSDFSGQCDVSDWKDIVAISAGNSRTVGLKSDGTVVAVGDNFNGRCNVSDWMDIVAIAVGYYHTVGLKVDGTVVTVGDNGYGQCDVSDWTDIVAVSAGDLHTVGLKSDGTVVAVGDNDDGQCDVSDWTDIVAASAGAGHTVGLKSDGTVVAVGLNDDGQCDVSDWNVIVAVSAGSNHTVGLKSDGTVVATGFNGNGQCDVNGWTDIVAVSAGDDHTVGLKSDGTVVAVGWNDDSQCDVSGWRNIRLP